MQSISNARLTLLRKLNRKKYREQERLFVVEGARAVEQVISNGRLEIQELFFDSSQDLWRQEPWQEFAESYRSAVMDTGHFSEISDTDTPQGVLALCKMPAQTEPAKQGVGSGIVVATDGIQDPGNLGTIIRTSVWFGVSGLVLGKGTVDPFHPKVVRSTAGSTGVLPYWSGSLKKVLSEFEKRGWRVLLLHGAGHSKDLSKISPSNKTVLVVGNEARGIGRALFAEGRTEVTISSHAATPSVESLNAAMATGIALYALS